MSKEMFIDVLPEGMAGAVVDCPDCQRVGFQRYRICYDHAYAHRWAEDAMARPSKTDRAMSSDTDAALLRTLAERLRAEAASIEVGPYDDFALGHVHGLEEAADLLDGDR